MGASGAGAGGSDAGFENTKKSQLSKKNQAKADKKAKAEANVEMGLGSDRMSNYSTSEGGTREGGGGRDQGTNILIAPTVAEVSQSNAANASTPVEEDPLYLRKKKTKAKGRSATILTSSKGVDEGLTLGKKSLLGS
jgi:hypothetical protein